MHAPFPLNSTGKNWDIRLGPAAREAGKAVSILCGYVVSKILEVSLDGGIRRGDYLGQLISVTPRKEKNLPNPCLYF